MNMLSTNFYLIPQYFYFHNNNHLKKALAKINL